jgi:hypothetical protein
MGDNSTMKPATYYRETVVDAVLEKIGPNKDPASAVPYGVLTYIERETAPAVVKYGSDPKEVISWLSVEDDPLSHEQKNVMAEHDMDDCWMFYIEDHRDRGIETPEDRALVFITMTAIGAWYMGTHKLAPSPGMSHHLFLWDENSEVTREVESLLETRETLWEQN